MARFGVIAVGVMLTAFCSLAHGQRATTLPVDQRSAATQPGRGGAFNNPSALLYTQNCQGCHGSDLAGGRSPSLFDEKWLTTTKDDEIISSIREGVPGTEMKAFKNKLNEDQIATLIKYIRTQSGTFKPKPVFVADPNGTVLKTEKQTV